MQFLPGDDRPSDGTASSTMQMSIFGEDFAGSVDSD
jgi:hypothetical protein